MADNCYIEPLQDASFNGAAFFVDTDDDSVGRRVVTHEMPMRDDPIHEDMGERVEAFKVKGYLHGDAAMAMKEAIRAACRTGGPGLLVLPATAPMLARCLNLTITRSKDKQGWFDLSFEFKAETNGGLDLTFAIGEFEMLLGSIAGTLGSVVGSLASTALAFAGYLPFVFDNVVARIELFADFFLSVVEETPLLVDDEGAALIFEATMLSINAETYASDPAALVSAVGSMLENLSASVAIEDAPAALWNFVDVQFRPAQKLVTPVANNKLSGDAPSISETQDATNDLLFNGAVRQLGLVYYGQAISRSSISIRKDAITLRADFVEACNSEIHTLDGDEDCVVVMTRVRDQTVKFLSQAVIDAAPIIKIDATASLPALYWAWRLYADPTRAEELALRNDLPDPAFVPATFEALAR